MINRFETLLQKLLSDSNKPTFKTFSANQPIDQDKFETESAYIENLMMQTKYWKDAMSFLKCNCLLLLIMIALIVGVIILFCVIYGIMS